MYCPRCGQQLAREIRFCSRCGLPMNVVAEIVANEGAPVDRTAPDAMERRECARPGMRHAARLIFLSLILLPICLGISFQADSPVPLFVPLTVFLVGLFWLFYAYIFGESPFAANPAGQLGQPRFATPRGELLTPPKSTVEGFIARSVDTGEILEPPGVTDHTTRLLD